MQKGKQKKLDINKAINNNASVSENPNEKYGVLKFYENESLLRILYTMFLCLCIGLS